jgi:heme/copper-type cytochrome/quinol oxidase subunit 2
MREIRVKRLAAGLASVILATVVLILCALGTPTAQAIEPMVYTRHTPTVTMTATETVTATVTATVTEVSPTTQRVFERSSVVLTKYAGSEYSTGWIIAGIVATVMGMLTFFYIGYRDGNNNNRSFVKDTIKQIKER